MSQVEQGAEVGQTNLEAFVAALERPLQATLDRESLEEYRNNCRFHLECLIDEHLASGVSETEAARLAIDDFGDAEFAASAMLDEYCRGRKPAWFSRNSSSAFWWSFGWFGLASGVWMLAGQVASIWPSAVSTDAVMGLGGVFAPMLAGIAVGRNVPTGNLRALGLAFVPLAFHALCAGLLLGWQRGGLFVPLLFVFAWIPLGAIGVTLSSWLRRNRRGPVVILEVSA